MSRKVPTGKRLRRSLIPVLLVGPPSASVDRKKRLRDDSGFAVTLADNICYAEAFSETQYFEAAVFDAALPPHEQASLANVMRIRWPWMRLVACGPILAEALFDENEPSESELPDALRRILALRQGS